MNSQADATVSHGVTMASSPTTSSTCWFTRTSASQDDDGLKFKVYGPIANGDDYAVVVNVNDDHLFVITCHLPP